MAQKQKTTTKPTPAALPPITLHNALASSDLNVVELIDPNRVAFYAKSLADQINTFRMGYAPPKRIIDLEHWVSSITIETSAQGSSLLEVGVIDPAWTLFLRDSNGVSFIDADETGYLWPPVEVTFPQDISDATWRLCAVRVATDLTQANVTLTFEDKIVSELREHSKQQTSFPNQTRAEFIQQLIKQANNSPAYPGEVDIRFVALLPKSTFTTQDLTTSQRFPASAAQQYAPPARQHPNKEPGTGTVQESVGQAIVEGVDINIEQATLAYATSVSPKTYSPTTPAPNVLSPLTPGI